jgi:two-component system, cell cycle sensor histidine kinase and response regulator CckA
MAVSLLSLLDSCKLLLKNRSLKTKMALSVSALFVIASASISFFAIAYLENELRLSIANQQDTLARNIADTLDDKFRTAQQTLRTTSLQLTPAMLTDHAKAQFFLNDKLALRTIFTDRLFILDASGIMIAASPLKPDLYGRSFAFREYFKETARSRKPVISEPFLSVGPALLPVIALTEPIFNRQGKLTCVLVGVIRLTGSNFLGELPRMKIGKAGYPYLITSDGAFIVHPDSKRIMKPAPPRGVNLLFDRALAGFEGTGDTVNSYGIAMLTSFRHLRCANWVLGVNLPADEAYAVVYRLRRYLVCGIAAGTLLTLGIVWLLLQRLTRPIVTITRQVEGMDVTAQLTPLADCTDSYSEIGTLRLAFNNLIETVQQQQLTLQQNEKKYRIVADNTYDWECWLSPERSFVYSSPACQRITGYTDADFLDTPGLLERVVHPDDSWLFEEHLSRSEALVGVHEAEFRIVRHDGAIRWVAHLCQPIYDDNGCYLGLRCTTCDITDQKRSEQALRESEETLRHLMESMPVGVALIREDGSIDYVNHYFEALFGYSSAEIPTAGQLYAHIYPDPGHRETVVAELETTLAQAQANCTPVAPIEFDATCKDGAVRHIILNRQLFGSRRMIICTDITERESLQNERLKTQKLESLGVLAGGIAHDFNNILTGILGNISFGRMFLDETHSSFIPLGHAEKASLRAAELAAQLLTFAKGGTPVKKAVQLPPLVEESMSLVLRGANVKGVIRIPDTLPAVEADEGQISQAFHNVILNAVQAMPEGGNLTVSAQVVTLSPGNKEGLPPRDYVMLSFADQGVGIPSAIRQKIFDPYFTTKASGTGLGLASVHSIVSRHGGRIEVSSEPAKGSVFTLLLPTAGKGAAAPAVGSEPAAVPVGGGERVLVMDDEALILDLASQLLGHLGYRVTACASGDRAIALYREAKEAGTPFHAAIMDLTVPGAMGGKEASQRILDIDPSARLIVSSGYSSDPIMAEYEKYGFRAAIAKPYKGQDLARVLSALI